MTRKKIIVFSLFLIINSSNLFGFNNEIIPKPDSQILSTGEFILSEKTKINYNGSFKISADFLKDFLKINLNSDKIFSGTVSISELLIKVNLLFL